MVVVRQPPSGSWIMSRRHQERCGRLYALEVTRTLTWTAPEGWPAEMPASRVGVD